MNLELSDIADDIDRLITLDLNRRGTIKVLYRSARESMGRPLVQAAAEALSEAVAPGSVVLVATGWPDRPWITPRIGELDGPPGAAILARSLHHVLGAVPVFLIEEQLVPAMKATACAAGFAVVEPDQAVRAAESPAPLHAASVLPFPTDPAAAVIESDTLMSSLGPDAVICIEKGSANAKGIIHNARGMDNTEHMAKADELVRKAKENGVLTIGIGDGGNEVGMGLIAEAVRESVPFGRSCNCPCGGGIAPELETDLLITSVVSNWGAYGLAACLAVLKGEYGGLHDPEMELRVLREAADAGLIDGNTGYVDPGADGLPAATHAAIVTLLRQIALNALSPQGLSLAQGSRQAGNGR